MLVDMGDIMNHRGHGLWGALIVEPEGAEYLDPKTMNPLKNTHSQSAIIKTENKTFREFVLFMQDGLGLYDKDGNLILDTPDEDELDFEDQGQKGFNYRSERFENRFIKNSNPLYAFSSRKHGDPATPVLEAYAGEDVTIRLLMPSDKPRNNCFVLHGHTWKMQPTDPLSSVVWSQGAISIGSVFNIEFAANRYPGDYLYRSGAFRWSVEQGMWGIFRVKSRTNHISVVVFTVIIVFCISHVLLWLYRMISYICMKNKTNKKRKRFLRRDEEPK